MRYFQEVELANFMPISEAAEWIAFGFLPMAEFDVSADGKPVETRENIDLILDKMSHHIERSAYLGKSLLTSVFPEVEPTNYTELLDRCGGQSVEEALLRLESARSMQKDFLRKERDDKEGEDFEGDFQRYISDLEIDLEAATAFRKAYAPIARKKRVAQAKLFLALIGGDISARGIEIPLSDDVVSNWDSDDWPNSFQPVPPEKWVAEGISWEDSNLMTWDARYIGVIVSTADVLKQFPSPDIIPKEVSGELYGETVILNIDQENFADQEHYRPKRGAPRRIEKVLDDAIYAHLDTLSQSGSLPSKIEAQVAEISGFVQSRLGQPISRSTAQRLRASWKDRYAQKDAQK